MSVEQPSAEPAFAPEPAPAPEYDEFGMDREYIARCGKTLFKFLCDYYWRIEARGLEHLPRQGPAVLAGTPRGVFSLERAIGPHPGVDATRSGPLVLTPPPCSDSAIISTPL